MSSPFEDKILTVFDRIAPLSKHGEPVRALACTYVFGAALVLIGEVNAVAPLLTMCFLVAYTFMNFSCFVLTYVRSPGFRPAGRDISKLGSLKQYSAPDLLMFLLLFKAVNSSSKEQIEFAHVPCNTALEKNAALENVNAVTGMSRRRWRFWYMCTGLLGSCVCLSIMIIVSQLWAIVVLLSSFSFVPVHQLEIGASWVGQCFGWHSLSVGFELPDPTWREWASCSKLASTSPRVVQDPSLGRVERNQAPWHFTLLLLPPKRQWFRSSCLRPGVWQQGWTCNAQSQYWEGRHQEHHERGKHPWLCRMCGSAQLVWGSELHHSVEWHRRFGAQHDLGELASQVEDPQQKGNGVFECGDNCPCFGEVCLGSERASGYADWQSGWDNRCMVDDSWWRFYDPPVLVASAAPDVEELPNSNLHNHRRSVRGTCQECRKVASRNTSESTFVWCRCGGGDCGWWNDTALHLRLVPAIGPATQIRPAATWCPGCECWRDSAWDRRPLQDGGRESVQWLHVSAWLDWQSGGVSKGRSCWTSCRLRFEEGFRWPGRSCQWFEEGVRWPDRSHHWPKDGGGPSYIHGLQR